MYDFNDFVHTNYVKHCLTGEVFKVRWVDTFEPVIYTEDEDGDERIFHAHEVEPMDIGRSYH